MPSTNDMSPIKSDYFPLAAAAHRTVRAYPGGSKALSQLLGKTPETLENEVNPNDPSRKLGLLDSVLIQEISRNYAILYEYAAILKHHCLPLRELEDLSNEDFLPDQATNTPQADTVAKQLGAALARGKLNQSEYQSLRQEGLRQVQRFHTLLFRLEKTVSS
ncbi:MAG: phage regulatory CII family protein [Pseudomonadales bacterium]|nr:phage regulatory CII family protein [Pseudomonadales bacterium]